jgi:hypothetical protein
MNIGAKSDFIPTNRNTTEIREKFWLNLASK